MSTWNPHLHQLRVLKYAADRVPPFNPLSSIRKNMVAVPLSTRIKKTDRFFIRFLEVFWTFRCVSRLVGWNFRVSHSLPFWSGRFPRPTKFHLKQIGAKRTPPRMSNRKCYICLGPKKIEETNFDKSNQNYPKDFQHQFLFLLECQLYL